MSKTNTEKCADYRAKLKSGHVPKRYYSADEWNMARRKNARDRQAKHRARDGFSDDDIAVLDFETTPFDNTKPHIKIEPFLAVLYTGPENDPVIIWDENLESFITRVLAAIEALPRRYTVYAHNGGRFDFKFLMHKLRGGILLKGSTLMQATCGRHELRDSMLILPTSLGAYRKDDFDYSWTSPELRNAKRPQIIEYCIADCAYLLEFIKEFIKSYGRKLTVGQAAMSAIKQIYPDLGTIGEKSDQFLRQWYFGGRVECLKGAGRFKGRLKLFDVNSMYPYVMSKFFHPSDGNFAVSDTITDKTVFIKLRCRNEHRAFLSRPDATELKSASISDAFNYHCLTSERKFGVFFVTIHEYRIAEKYDLISDVEILETIDFQNQTTFARFVDPLYAQRELDKLALAKFKAEGQLESEAAYTIKRQSIVKKYVLNSGYGKFAQNPREFKDRELHAYGEKPDVFSCEANNWSELEFTMTECCEAENWALWERPCKQEMRFNNVAIAASITGAARSVLLEAIVNSTGALYCDTDSLICEDLRNVHFDASELGAWDLEDEFDDVIIIGKKTYAARNTSGSKIREKLRAKGVSGLTWSDYEAMIAGKEIVTRRKAPTLYIGGHQEYITRKIRVTTKRAA